MTDALSPYDRVVHDLAAARNDQSDEVVCATLDVEALLDEIDALRAMLIRCREYVQEAVHLAQEDFAMNVPYPLRARRFEARLREERRVLAELDACILGRKRDAE